MPSVLAIMTYYLLMTPLCVTCREAGGRLFLVIALTLEIVALLPQLSKYRPRFSSFSHG